jgi:hypothetical protein
VAYSKGMGCTATWQGSCKNHGDVAACTVPGASDAQRLRRTGRRSVPTCWRCEWRGANWGQGRCKAALAGPRPQGPCRLCDRQAGCAAGSTNCLLSHPRIITGPLVQPMRGATPRRLPSRFSPDTERDKPCLPPPHHAAQAT